MATTTNMSLGKPFKPFKNQTAGMGDRFFIFRMIRECEKPVLPIRYPQFLQDMGGIPLVMTNIAMEKHLIYYYM